MASQTKMPASELEWDHAVHDIPERGCTGHRQASSAELARVSRALGLVSCSRLTADYTIKPALDGRYRLHGSYRAEVSQACVVTLDPVDSVIEDSFDVTFWPAEQMPAAGSGAITLDDEPDPEPIRSGLIAVGRVVFECLAAAIDPFPRARGAALEQHASAPPGADASKPEGPFAVLANIKPKG